MTRLRDPHTGRFISLKQRIYNRLMVERAARLAGIAITEWRAGERPVIRIAARTEARP
jgi:hypothetical protein